MRRCQGSQSKGQDQWGGHLVGHLPIQMLNEWPNQKKQTQWHQAACRGRKMAVGMWIRLNRVAPPGLQEALFVLFAPLASTKATPGLSQNPSCCCHWQSDRQRVRGQLRRGLREINIHYDAYLPDHGFTQAENKICPRKERVLRPVEYYTPKKIHEVLRTPTRTNAVR